jgi:hypothetical protein
MRKLISLALVGLFAISLGCSSSTPSSKPPAKPPETPAKPNP